MGLLQNINILSQNIGTRTGNATGNEMTNLALREDTLLINPNFHFGSKASMPAGYIPGYTWVPSQSTGGLGASAGGIAGLGSQTSALSSGRNIIASIAGTCTQTSTIKATGDIASTSKINGAGSISTSNLNALGNIVLAIAGLSNVVATINALGNIGITLPGTSSFTGTIIPALNAIATIAGLGSISTRILNATAHITSELDGSGIFSHANLAGAVHLGSTIEGLSSFESDITAESYIQAHLVGLGAFSILGSAAIKWAAADLLGSSLIAASLSSALYAGATLSGSGVIESARLGLVKEILALLAGTSSILASLGSPGPMAAELLGNSAISNANLAKGIDLLALLAGSSSTSATARAVGNAIAGISGSCSLMAEAIRGICGSAHIYGVGALGAELDALAHMAVLLSAGGLFTSHVRADAFMTASIDIGASDSAKEIIRGVWSAVSEKYNDPGSMGHALNAAGTAADPWSANLPGTYLEGSAGHIIGNLTDPLHRVLGLVQDNFRLMDQIYDEHNNLTSATVKIYSSASNVEIDHSPIAEYLMTATFDGPNKCTSYKMKRVS